MVKHSRVSTYDCILTMIYVRIYALGIKSPKADMYDHHNSQ